MHLIRFRYSRTYFPHPLFESFCTVFLILSLSRSYLSVPDRLRLAHRLTSDPGGSHYRGLLFLLEGPGLISAAVGYLISIKVTSISEYVIARYLELRKDCTYRR